MLSVERIEISEIIKKGECPSVACSWRAMTARVPKEEEAMSFGDLLKNAGFESSQSTKSDDRLLKWAAAGIELLGEERLVTALRRAINEGTNRARERFDSLIEREIGNFPHALAEIWRTRLPRLGGQKGCPTFCEEGEDVLEMISSGEAIEFAKRQREIQLEADTLVWPSMEPDEDRRKYHARLEAWAADKPEHLLKAAGFDSFEISCREDQKREEKRRREGEKLASQAIKSFNRTGNFDELSSVYEKLKGRYFPGSLDYAAGSSNFGWKLAAEGKIKIRAVSVEPEIDWLKKQENLDFLIRCVFEAHDDYGGIFFKRILEILPGINENTAYVTKGLVITKKVITELMEYSWFNNDRYSRFQRDRVSDGSPADGYIPTVPHPDGWVTVKRVKLADGRTSTRATFYNPKQFSALQTALQCEAGSINVRDWLEDFGRHPQKGFGRFLFRVQPGGRNWDQMFISVDERLRERIELLRQLPDPEDVPFPENIWYIPARLSVKSKGGHMRWDENNKERAITWKRKASRSQKSCRSIGDSIAIRSTGTAIAWKLGASTRKHYHTMVVAVIGEGKELHLKSGLAICNVGGKLEEIPGGAM